MDLVGHHVFFLFDLPGRVGSGKSDVGKQFHRPSQITRAERTVQTDVFLGRERVDLPADIFQARQNVVRTPRTGSLEQTVFDVMRHPVLPGKFVP